MPLSNVVYMVVNPFEWLEGNSGTRCIGLYSLAFFRSMYKTQKKQLLKSYVVGYAITIGFNTYKTIPILSEFLPASEEG